MAGNAVTWTLPTSGGVPTHSGTESFLVEETTESVMQPDLRSRVDARDFADGGKYRSIVKLIISYEGRKEKGYAMGTGWLIKPDLMVTAGHNVFNWDGYGKAKEIKCFIGYQGSDSVTLPSVQFRLAKTIVTTAEWMQSRENRHRDVAFIKVDRPFDGDLRLFSYKSTPVTGHFMLGVVGYPGDKTMDTEAGEENGAEMYEMFAGQKYSLDEPGTRLSMLEYYISTFGGQSGAPVIRKESKTMTVIGTHVYGYGDKNSASAIGKRGNDYDILLKAFEPQNLPLVSEKTENGIKVKIVKVDSSSSAPASAWSGPGALQPATTSTSTGFANGFTSTGFTKESSSSPNEEGFFDIFSTIGEVVSGAAPIIAPFLGPIGGPIAAIAGAAIGTLAGRSESAFVNSGSEDDAEETAKAAADRAVLAEAALQTVLNMEHNDSLVKVIGHMEECYKSYAPNVKHLAPKLAPVILDAARKINPNGEFNMLNSRPRQTLPPRRLHTNGGAESTFDGGVSDFTAALLQREVHPLVGEEGFFDGLGSAISSGLRIAKPWLAKGAKIGLSLLNDHLSAATESAFVDPSVPPEAIKAAELVTQRAILGEAALQALDKLNKHDLAKIRVTSGGGEEGFFSGFTSIVQGIGGAVKKYAPSVIKTVMPIAQNLLASHLGGGGGAGESLPVPNSSQTLRKKLSCAELLRSGRLQNLSVGGAGTANGPQTTIRVQG